MFRDIVSLYNFRSWKKHRRKIKFSLALSWYQYYPNNKQSNNGAEKHESEVTIFCLKR